MRSDGRLLASFHAISAKMQRLDQLASFSRRESDNMNCPDEKVWFDVAAGRLSTERSLQHVQHASGCSFCAQKLRKATHMFVIGATLEEEKEIEISPSRSSERQRELAEKLGRKTDPYPSPPQKTFNKR